MDTPGNSQQNGSLMEESFVPQAPKNAHGSIRTPKVTNRTIAGNSWLNEAETGGPRDNKLIMPAVAKRAARKAHPVRTAVVWIALLALLGYAGYRAYLIFGPRAGQPAAQTAVGDRSEPPVADDFQAANPPVAAGASDSSRTLAVASGTDPSDITGATSTAVSATGTASSAVPTSTPPVVSTAPRASAVAGAATKSLKINSNSLGYLNVRSEPTSSGKVVTQVHPGEQYTYSDKKYGWYQIMIKGNQTGWVSGQYVTIGN